MRLIVFSSACLTLLLVSLPARALLVAPAPIPERVALADVVVVGKITAIEDKTVKAARYPNSGEKTEMKVALIQADLLLKGAKVNRIRLGFVPPPPPPAPPKPGEPVIVVSSGGRNRFPQLDHQVGQEAIFFLTKHHDQDFYVVNAYYDVIEKKNPNFDKDLAEVKRCAALLEKPTESLQSKNADERLMTAAMLLARYRSARIGGKPNPKQEPIPAEESKLILQAIAASDWSVAGRDPARVSPFLLFQRLGLTAQDGWNPPPFKDFQKEMPPVAQKWLKDNAAKYRIQKFVTE